MVQRPASGAYVFALRECPACGGGRREGIPVSCALCNDSGRVSHFVAAQWELQQGKEK